MHQNQANNRKLKRCDGQSLQILYFALKKSSTISHVFKMQSVVGARVIRQLVMLIRLEATVILVRIVVVEVFHTVAKTPCVVAGAAAFPWLFAETVLTAWIH